MEKNESNIGTIIITAIIVGFFAYFVGYSAHSGETGSSNVTYDTDENSYSEDQYQEVVNCLEDANNRLSDINNDAGTFGDGSDYEDLVNELESIESNAETFCEGDF